MSMDVCKACGGNGTDLQPIKKGYLGLDISKIICKVVQLNNSEVSFGDSLICTSCITALHLINAKIENLRRAFVPSGNGAEYNFGCSTPITTKTATSSNKKTTSSNKNVTSKTPSKKTPNANAKNATETEQNDVAAKSSRAGRKITNVDSESSLSNEIIGEKLSSTILAQDSEIKEKKIPKRRMTIYHFDCEFCDFQTGIIKAMQQHLTDQHEVKFPRIFECKECSTKYTAKQGLDLHNKRHHLENGNVQTHKNTTSSAPSKEEEEEEAGQVTITKVSSPIKNNVLSKSPQKPASPVVRPSPQKQKTPSDVKKGLNFIPSDSSFFSPNAMTSNTSNPVAKQMYQCDECPKVCDSLFDLDLHRSAKHCFITNISVNESIQQSDDGDDDDVDYGNHTQGKSNGFIGKHHNDQEVPETDSDADSETQEVIAPFPKKSPKKAQKVTTTQQTGVRKISSAPVSNPKPNSKATFNSKCDFCPAVFDSLNAYAKHLTERHGIEEPRVFKCPQCGKSYKTRPVLQRHIKNVHEKNRTDDNVESDDEKDNDISKTRDDSDIEVSRVESSQVLEDHEDAVSTSSLDFPFQIAKINALPARTSIDQDRTDVPVQQKSIPCPKCPDDFSNLSALKNHLQVVHEDSEAAIYTCDLCPAKYKHNKNLKRHKEKHHSSSKANEDLAIDTDHLIVSEEDSKKAKKQKKEKKEKTADNSINAGDGDCVIKTEIVSPKKRKRSKSKSEEEPAKSPKKSKQVVSIEEDKPSELESKKTVTCSICNKSFKSKEKLERHHNKKHPNLKQSKFFGCIVGSCPKNFLDQSFLDAHMKKKHPGVAI